MVNMLYMCDERPRAAVYAQVVREMKMRLASCLAVGEYSDTARMKFEC